MSDRAGVRPVRSVYAGSLDALVQQDLIPAFERLTGCECHAQSGGSRDWALRLRDGDAQADVFLSADAEVIRNELMASGLVPWALAFAANALVLAYSASPARPEIALAARGELPLVGLLTSGLRLGRPDPESDPKGYRSLFVLQLLEAHLGQPGLADAALGAPRNPGQVFPPARLIPMLEDGRLDLIFAYRSQAVEEGLPFLSLPGEVDLGRREYADLYAWASYRCDDGAEYRGSPITYAAALLPEGLRSHAAVAFLLLLGSDAMRSACTRRGFGPIFEIIPAGGSAEKE